MLILICLKFKNLHLFSELYPVKSNATIQLFIYLCVCTYLIKKTNKITKFPSFLKFNMYFKKKKRGKFNFPLLNNYDLAYLCYLKRYLKAGG